MTDEDSVAAVVVLFWLLAMVIIIGQLFVVLRTSRENTTPSLGNVEQVCIEGHAYYRVAGYITPKLDDTGKPCHCTTK